MGRSQESFNKKEVRKNKEKKRKEKEKKRLARKETEKASGLDDMIAYVDEYGNITSTPPDPGKKGTIALTDIAISVPKKDPALQHDPIRHGIVSFFNESKGFGFIKDSESQESVFVHVNNLKDIVSEGDNVSFEVEHGPRGLSAIRITIIKKA